MRLEVTIKLLLRHILLLGATGSGKTNHAFHLIEQALESEGKMSVVIIDVKGEYGALKGLLPEEVVVRCVGDEPWLKFNPLIPPREVRTDLWDRAFADVFTRAYGLSEPSRRILLDSLYELRENRLDNPSLRDLERKVATFEAGSPKEMNSKRSLESRLHLINTGPVGSSLNAERSLDVEGLDETVTVFEIGQVDSLRDQRFLAELILLHLWLYDKRHAVEDEEVLKRLIVVEEAHRYLSEERPPAQRGDRTLLELAVAEARRYGWGFIIIDQMPLLLSRYVWDNVGTVLVHRLTNSRSYELVEDALGGAPVKDEPASGPILALRLPEDLALFRSYPDNFLDNPVILGVITVPKVISRRKNDASQGRPEVP